MWSPQQDDALLKVARWLEAGESSPQIFRLFGFAGTGKTTLARHFAEGVTGEVKFAAFTGKAAQILREKGCRGASTIHSLIYRPKEKNRQKLVELERALLELKASPEPHSASLRQEIERQEWLVKQERKDHARPSFDLNQGGLETAKLIIIDECSMVDNTIGSDLASYGKKILVLGDPAQLPPVMGGGFFTEGHTPDVMLTEIHRQAEENPIIVMATKIRLGESLELGPYGESRYITKNEIDREEVVEADQLLVGKNATRHAFNRRMRSLRGLEGVYPLVGERLICLRNNHDKGFLNGSQWIVEATSPSGSNDTVLFTLRDADLEEAQRIDSEAWAFPFLGGSPNDMPWWERSEADEFDYGYAVTVHKAQGSEYPHVVLFDEWRFRDSRQRWLYTAITRASKKITIVKY